MEENKYDPNNK